MAASEYICKICNEVKTAGIFGGKKKYKCPTHGWICPACVKWGLFKNKCKTCESKVVKYSWVRKTSKWVNS